MFIANYFCASVPKSFVGFYSFSVFIIYYPKTRALISEISIKRILPLFFLVVFVLFYFFKSHLPNLIFIILSLIITLFYFIKIGKKKTLRENFKTKAVAISLAWVFFGIGFIVKTIDLKLLMPFILNQFLFVWALTVPFDFADLEADKQHGIVNFFENISSQNAFFISGILLLFQLLVGINFMDNLAFVTINFLQAIVCCYLGFKLIKKPWYGDIVELAFFLQWFTWYFCTK